MSAANRISRDPIDKFGNQVDTNFPFSDLSNRPSRPDVFRFLRVTITQPCAIPVTVLGILFANGWRRWLCRQEPGERSKLNLYG
jgi:hypothetical protein